MRLCELLRNFDILEINCDPDLDITDICYDSRKISPGALFVAIKGFESDGHNYIDQAFANGCSAVICENIGKSEYPHILVKNSRLSLAFLSAAFFGYPAEHLKLIGVTGTNGKTTVTTLLKELIESCTGDKVGLIGSNRNMIADTELPAEHTTPESRDLHELFAQMLQAGCKYVVMEVSSHSLVLNRVAGLYFDTAVFTNLSQDHLDFHSDMDDYLNAKSMLFKNCKNAVLNADDPASAVLSAKIRCSLTTFGIDNCCDARASDIDLGVDYSAFTLTSQHGRGYARLAIPGKFSVMNALAAITTGLTLSLPLEVLIKALNQCRGVKGRAEVVPVYGQNFSVLIDYAVTPDAFENILNTVRAYAKGRIVMLFGCGGDRDRKKRPLMGAAAAKLADFLIITSDNPRTEKPMSIINDILEGVRDKKTPYVVIEDRSEAIHWAIKNAMPDDTILLAGKGHETYQIVGKTKRHMDEREIVNEALKEYYTESR